MTFSDALAVSARHSEGSLSQSQTRPPRLRPTIRHVGRIEVPMAKAKILVQLDTDPHPSLFDSIVAVDAGADNLLRISECHAA